MLSLFIYLCFRSVILINDCSKFNDGAGKLYAERRVVWIHRENPQERGHRIALTRYSYISAISSSAAILDHSLCNLPFLSSLLSPPTAFALAQAPIN